MKVTVRMVGRIAERARGGPDAELDEGSTVADLLVQLGLTGPGIIAFVRGDRASGALVLFDGDVVDLIQAVAGGRQGAR